MTELEKTRTSDTDRDVSRRNVLRGVAVGGVALPLLAACGGGGDSSGSSSSDPASGGGSASGGATVTTADVPVGGGTILKDQQVVVTQPDKGDFKAFTAVCTHQGCLVGKVSDKKIICPCHGSEYSITDGAVLGGPAPAPLAAKQVSVKGHQISVT